MAAAPSDPGEVTQHTPSFDEFQRQTSLMTSCTLLWKELSDHFNSLEQDILKKSESIKLQIQTLESQTQSSLHSLARRESTIDESISIALKNLEKHKKIALDLVKNDVVGEVNGAAGGVDAKLRYKNKRNGADLVRNDAVGEADESDGSKRKKTEGDLSQNGDVEEVDDSEGLLLKLRFFCITMDALGFWSFVTARKKEIDDLRAQIPVALGECVDPARFALEAISEVFPVDKRSECVNDLGWACVLVLESLIPVMVDPVLGRVRMLVTPSVRRTAKEIAEAWKVSLEERGGIENVKTPDVHTFLQHLVTFGIVRSEDLDLYRKLVVASAWRKQMPKLAVSLGLGDEMPDMIEELISRGQQVDAVHFAYEVGLVDKFPPVPLLKSFLKDARKVATSILEDPNNSGRAAHLASRKEQSALRAVVKCIEEYKLEAEFPPENLKKRLEQLEKVKTEKKRPAAAVPASKRTRASNVGPMPPAKAGRIANAYVSSFPSPPIYVKSPPSHTQYPVGVPQYPVPTPMYGHGNLSPPTNAYAAYSPESIQMSSPNPYSAYSPESVTLSPPLASYPVSPMNYPAYGGYGNGMAPAYQQAYYR